jgi:CelD/BcsL family acetyltransferase involved in cellulose biosynthesis
MALLNVDDRRWTDFVEASPDSLPFHHPAWAHSLGKAYGFRTFAVVLTDATDRITAGMPLMEVSAPLRRPKWVALPFTDVCPPLIGPGASLEDLLAEVDAARWAAGVAHVEVRAEVAGPHAHARTSGVIHRLDLESDAEALLRRVGSQQTRRNVRRAQREGVQIRRGASRSDLTEVFYRLHVDTRRRLGVPVQPQRFFEALWDHLIEPGLGFVSIAEAGGTGVAGALFLAWRGTLTYKYGASDAAYWPLRPNHLIFWDAISWSCAHGYRTVDFGRSDASNLGLRQFKSGWGAEETTLVYTTITDRPLHESRGQLASALRPAIRHAPPWVCRALGRLLYRYAA